MTDRKIIAFYGYKGCGKSEAGKVLIPSGFVPLSFAAPLKNMLTELGLSIDEVWGDQKEVPSELLGGKTPRHAMQTLGTEWGRECIDPDLWLRAWKRHLVGYGRYDIIVDDLRFPNEFRALKEMGATVVKIARPGKTSDGHESERYVDDEEAIRPDYVITNEDTLETFRARIVGLLSHVSHVGGE